MLFRHAGFAARGSRRRALLQPIQRFLCPVVADLFDRECAGDRSVANHLTQFRRCAFEQYNHASHEYVLSVPAGGRIVFRIGATEFELKADGAMLRAAQLLADVPDSTFTGNQTTEKLLTFNGGMQGKAGAGGGIAVKVGGGAEFADDVVAAGKAVSKHSHREPGDGELVSEPI
nr:hypothetical protein [Burkholderia territorii]